MLKRTLITAIALFGLNSYSLADLSPNIDENICDDVIEIEIAAGVVIKHCVIKPTQMPIPTPPGVLKPMQPEIPEITPMAPNQHKHLPKGFYY